MSNWRKNLDEMSITTVDTSASDPTVSLQSQLAWALKLALEKQNFDEFNALFTEWTKQVEGLLLAKTTDWKNVLMSSANDWVVIACDFDSYDGQKQIFTVNKFLGWDFALVTKDWKKYLYSTKNGESFPWLEDGFVGSPSIWDGYSIIVKQDDAQRILTPHNDGLVRKFWPFREIGKKWRSKPSIYFAWIVDGVKGVYVIEDGVLLVLEHEWVIDDVSPESMLEKHVVQLKSWKMVYFYDYAMKAIEKFPASAYDRRNIVNVGGYQYMLVQQTESEKFSLRSPDGFIRLWITELESSKPGKFLDGSQALGFWEDDHFVVYKLIESSMKDGKLTEDSFCGEKISFPKKIDSIECLGNKNFFINWNGHSTTKRLYNDQGKEICVYNEWDGDKFEEAGWIHYLVRKNWDKVQLTWSVSDAMASYFAN